MRGRAWGLWPWVSRYGADQREIKEIKSERTMGRERDKIDALMLVTKKI